MSSTEKENPFSKYYAKFEKEQIHQGGSIPFWDWNFSARLKITTPNGTIVWLDSAELITLKKLLLDFNGVKGKWKTLEAK